MRKEKGIGEFFLLVMILIVAAAMFGGITTFMSQFTSFWSAQDTHAIANVLANGLWFAIHAAVALISWNLYAYQIATPKRPQNVKVIDREPYLLEDKDTIPNRVNEQKEEVIASYILKEVD